MVHKNPGGMLTSLQIANEKGAYILTDQSTWMNNKDQLTNLDYITTSAEGENIYSFLYNDSQYQVLADYLKLMRHESSCSSSSLSL